MSGLGNSRWKVLFGVLLIDLVSMDLLRDLELHLFVIGDATVCCTMLKCGSINILYQLVPASVRLQYPSVLYFKYPTSIRNSGLRCRTLLSSDIPA